MSIDISTETLLTLSQAASSLPSRPHLSTLHRWRLPPGVRGVTLDTCLIGGRRYTSIEAIERFVAATNAAADGAPAPVRSPARRERDIARAEAEMKEKLGCTQRGDNHGGGT